MADRKLFKEKLCAKITSSFFYVSQTMESNGLMLQLAHSLSHGTIPLKFVLNKAKVMWESTLLAYYCIWSQLFGWYRPTWQCKSSWQAIVIECAQATTIILFNFSSTGILQQSPRIFGEYRVQDKKKPCTEGKNSFLPLLKRTGVKGNELC